MPLNRLLYSIISLLPVMLFSQVKLVNEKDRAPVPYAHIFLDNRFYTYSNEKGEFTLPQNQVFDTLTIDHLTYQQIKLPYSAVSPSGTISIAEKVNNLAEVSVNLTRKRVKLKLLTPEKLSRNAASNYDFKLLYETGSTYGRDTNKPNILKSTAVYVPNKKRLQNARISKIVLDSGEAETDGDTLYMPFRVNLMSFDTLTGLPKEKLFTDDFVSGKKKGQKVFIDLNGYENITFPPEGICVVVSVYYTEYYVNHGYKKPPAFRASKINRSSGYREYESGTTLAPGWNEIGYSKTREQCFNFGIEITYSE